MSIAFDDSDLEFLVRERIDFWRAGGAPDAAEFLAEHPELRRAKSLVLELILEEYCLRRNAGDEVAASAYSERFPSYSQSVYEMLEVQEFLDKRPQVAESIERAGWPRSGSRFLDFDIIEPIGCGGLARVYLAREVSLGNRLVVIKVSQRGAREAQALGKLSHPNIVPIHSVKREELLDWTVICMPLLGTATIVDLLDAVSARGAATVDGTIVPWVARNAYPLREQLGTIPLGDERPWRISYSEAIARLSLELVGGLATAHRAGILHGDIKPSNILLGWTGRPMLLDFNLAFDRNLPSERVGGTPAYMAPELLADLIVDRHLAARRYSPACDIYSLGVVLFEMLAGRLPARPQRASSLLPDDYAAWLESKQMAPPALGSLGARVDSDLAQIVQKCLVPQPELRYSSAAELADDLAKYLALPSRIGRFEKQNRRVLIAAGIASLALIGGLGSYYATRPPLHEQWLKRGIEQYNQGEYAAAVESFSRCLQARDGLVEAHFGRGQAYRRLGEWEKARRDFVILAQAKEPWGFAFAGECDLDLKDWPGAWSDMSNAYNAGLRHTGFLLNYSDISSKQGHTVEARRVLDEILSAEPSNSTALRCRATLAHSAASLNQLPLAGQALDDTRNDIELNPDSFEAAYAAAFVFCYAARRDADVLGEGTGYLMKALRLGLPREVIDKGRVPLKPLWTDEVEQLAQNAPLAKKGYLYRRFWRQDLPSSADWRAIGPPRVDAQVTDSAVASRR